MKRYGEDAPIAAMMRVDAMVEKGDLDRYEGTHAVYALILGRAQTGIQALCKEPALPE